MKVLGLMSGTSCDGVTIAAVDVTGTPARPRARYLWHRERAYPAALRARLLAAAEGRGAAAEIAALHVELAELWAREVLRAAGGERGLRTFTLLASHGHTIHHRPPRGGKRGVSLQ